MLRTKLSMSPILLAQIPWVLWVGLDDADCHPEYDFDERYPTLCGGEREMNTENRKVGLFFILAFVYTWILYLPSVLVGTGLMPAPVNMAIYASITLIVGAFGPMLAAITLLVRSSGWSGAWQLIRKAFDFRLKPIYLLAAFLLPLVITAGAHYFITLARIDVLPDTLLPDNLPYPVIVWAIPAFFSMLFIGGGQEEFGWRGYAQEPLQDRFGVIKGSTLLGAIWGLWHLPLWFIPGDPHAFYPFIAFFIFTIAFSVQIAWLYNGSGKKLIIPWIMHAMNNTMLPLFPVYRLEPNVVQTGAWVYVGINVLIAIMIGFALLRSD